MTERRLAAILVADVVGYSRLVGADENGTLERLRALRADVIEPVAATRGGRLFKAVGDGFLLEFASAVQAVSAALDIQKAAGPDALPLRIGIHLGDVVIEGDDLLGDGVNTAARIEAVAEPGGIAISRAVHEQVRDRLDARFEDKGEIALKNIARPMHVFAIAAPVSAPPPAKGEPLTLPDKPSIAVLPFTNMSGDAEQEYFADGIVEDIITALSRFKSLFVIARNSSFTYKGKAIDVRQVGRELGVRYVLEGSVRKMADRVRVTAQLNDAGTGNHIWADRHEGRLASIFELQDEITEKIASALIPAFSRAELQRVRRKHPNSLDSWDLTLRAAHSFAQSGPKDVAHARELATQALRLDPRNATALATLSFSHVNEGWMGQSPSPEASIIEGIRVARLALQEDDSDAYALTSLGYGLFAIRRFDEALGNLRQAVSLNPNSIAAWTCYGTALAFCGDYENAMEALERGVRLSPLNPRVGMLVAQMAVAAFVAGRHREGIVHGRRATQLLPGFMGGHRGLAANLAAAGKFDEAASAITEARRIAPGLTVATTRALPFRDNEARERYCAALARAGLPE